MTFNDEPELNVTIPMTTEGTVNLQQLGSIIDDISYALHLPLRFNYHTFAMSKTFSLMVTRLDAELGFKTVVERRKGGTTHVVASKVVTAKKGKGGGTWISSGLAKNIFDLMINGKTLVCPSREKVSETAAIIGLEHGLGRPLARQYLIGSYRVDAYDYHTNTVYEIDENTNHSSQADRVNDIARLSDIRKLGYEVVVIRVPF
jgi:hypothetical protein